MAVMTALLPKPEDSFQNLIDMAVEYMGRTWTILGEKKWAWSLYIPVKHMLNGVLSIF